MLNSAIWGPPLWYFIHIISYNYNENYIDNYKDFFNLLKILIPCPVCRNHYNNYIHKNPLKINNKKLFIQWCFDFHNNVNRRLDNKIITLDECDKKYQTIDNKKILNFLKIFTKEHINKKVLFKKFILVILKMYPDNKIKNIIDYNIIEKSNNIIFLLLLQKFFKELEKN